VSPERELCASMATLSKT